MNTGNRHTTRRPGHDYTGPATYFVTLVTANRECLFGNVINGEMYLNSLGHIVRQEWLRSPEIRSELYLDRWIVMPNHLHGIVQLAGLRFLDIPGRPPAAPTTALKTDHLCRLRGCCRGVRRTPCQSGSLGSFIRGFKSVTTRRINELRGTQDAQVWQRNYDEHIIDNDQELQCIRQYIADNPKNWNPDECS